MLPGSTQAFQLRMQEDPSRIRGSNNHPRYNNHTRIPRGMPNRRGGNRNWIWKGPFRHLQQQQQQQQQQQPQQQTSLSSPPLQPNFPPPPFWTNDTGYNNEGYQPIYMSPHLPHLNNGYSGPPFMFHSQFGFGHPLAHPPPIPEAHFAPNPCGPFIINSQTRYDESIPTFDQRPFPPINQTLGSPCADTNQQLGHSEPYYPPNPRYLTPSYQEHHKITPPPREIEKPKDKIPDETTIEGLLELEEPEKPPKLICIYKPNSLVGTTEKDQVIHSTALQDPLKNHGQDPKDGLKKELEDGNETQTTELTLNSKQTSDTDQSYKGTRAGYLLVDRGSTKSRSRSRSCSSHSCTGTYAPCVASSLTNNSQAAKKTKPMCLKIEDYVRGQVACQNSELSEDLIKQVIEDMSLDKALREKLDTMERSGSKRSRSTSATPTCSSKPI